MAYYFVFYSFESNSLSVLAGTISMTIIHSNYDSFKAAFIYNGHFILFLNDLLA